MEVEDFVLDLDSIIRIGGIAGDNDDDANTIEAALIGAREKYTSP